MKMKKCIVLLCCACLLLGGCRNGAGVSADGEYTKEQPQYIRAVPEDYFTPRNILIYLLV